MISTACCFTMTTNSKIPVLDHAPSLSLGMKSFNWVLTVKDTFAILSPCHLVVGLSDWC